MKKSHKISGQIPQIGLDLSLENSQEISSKEIELQHKITSGKQNKNSKLIIDSLDFLTYGGFSIRNKNIAHKIEKNNTRITFEKTQELIEKSKLPTKPISLKLQKNFLENLSVEEDETLQNMWANMLANALTGQVDVEVIYIKILAELSPFDVHILEITYKVLEKGYTGYNYNAYVYNGDASPKNLISEPLINNNKSEEQVKSSLDFLFSKKLIESPRIYGNDNIKIPIPIQSSSYNNIYLTYLGEIFVRVCKFNSKYSAIKLSKTNDNPNFFKMRLE